MLTSYYILHLLARELDTVLRGKTVSAAYTQQKRRLVLAFGDSDPALVVDCTPRAATLYLEPRHARAKRNAVDVLPVLCGKTVKTVAIHPGDRVVVFDLSDHIQGIALCYGSSPNMLVVDSHRTIMDAFLGARQLAGTSYQLSRKEEEEIPDLGRLAPAIESSPGVTLPVILRRTFPRLGETLVREVLHRTRLDTRTAPIGDDDLDRITACLVEIHRELADPHPVIYSRGPRDKPETLSIVPLHHLSGLTASHYADIHEAVRVFVSRKQAAGENETGRQDLVSTLSRAAEKMRRSLDAVRHDLEEADRASAYERNGRLLLAHLAMIPRGDSAVTLDDDGEEVVIKLDPRLTASANAQKYFARARSARNAHREASVRMEELSKKEAATAALLAEIEQADSAGDLRRVLEERKAELAAFGIRHGRPDATPPLFRTFTVDGGFEVWAGKNSANNDLLTLRHARPNDLWFHARGGGGAHVVLRTGSGRGEPGKKAREQAAAIAAWYSKMKTAGMVPVAVTLRKYVRKPKGAPPGTVTIEREDVIFARPGLPEAR